MVYTFPYLYYDYEKYSNDPLNLYGARTLKNSNKRYIIAAAMRWGLLIGICPPQH